MQCRRDRDSSQRGVDTECERVPRIHTGVRGDVYSHRERDGVAGGQRHHGRRDRGGPAIAGKRDRHGVRRTGHTDVTQVQRMRDLFTGQRNEPFSILLERQPPGERRRRQPHQRTLQHLLARRRAGQCLVAEGEEQRAIGRADVRPHAPAAPTGVLPEQSSLVRVTHGDLIGITLVVRAITALNGGCNSLERPPSDDGAGRRVISQIPHAQLFAEIGLRRHVQSTATIEVGHVLPAEEQTAATAQVIFQMPAGIHETGRSLGRRPQHHIVAVQKSGKIRRKGGLRQ